MERFEIYKIFPSGREELEAVLSFLDQQEADAFARKLTDQGYERSGVLYDARRPVPHPEPVDDHDEFASWWAEREMFEDVGRGGLRGGGV